MYFNDVNSAGVNGKKEINSKEILKLFSEDNKAIQEQMKDFYHGLEDYTEKLMDVEPMNEEFFEKQVAPFNKYLSQNSKGKGKPEQFKFYRLSEAEKAERKAIHAEAKEIMKTMNGVYHTTSTILQAFNDEKLGTHVALDRATYIVSCIGCSSVEDVMESTKIYTSGTQEEKQAHFEKSIREALNIVKEIVPRKTDKEFVSFCKKNVMTLFALEDMEGSKLAAVEKELGVTVPENLKKEIAEYGPKITTAGSLINRIGTMANPYYTVLDERNMPFIECVNSKGDSYPDEEFLEVLGQRDDSGLKTCYDFGVISYSTKNHESDLSDYLSIYGIAHPDIQFKKEDGTVFHATGEDTKEMAKYIMEGKKLLALNQKGDFVGLVSANKDGFNVPDFNPATLDLDLKGDPKAVFASLKKMVNNLDSLLSINHQEFKNFKTFINDMNKNFEKGTGFSDLLKETKSLAEDYLNAKYQKGAPAKTSRTYDRIEFMGKLIHSIDEFNGFKPDMVAEAQASRQQIEIDNSEIVDESDLMDKSFDAKDLSRDDVRLSNPDVEEDFSINNV